jgi:ankyrin repeat protein
MKVELMLSTGAVDANVRLADTGLPALAVAVSHNQKAVVELLLRFNARVDDCDIVGQTATHWAASMGMADVLAMLLAARPNLALRSVISGTPLECSAHSYSEQCAMLLIEAGAPLQGVFLHHVAVCGPAVVQALVNRGVVVGQLRGYLSQTLLHVAAEGAQHKSALMNVLADDCGIGVDARDSRGNTACHYAARSAAGGNLRWLLEAGADIFFFFFFCSCLMTPVLNVAAVPCFGFSLLK